MEPGAPDQGPEERARLLFEQGVEAARNRRWEEAERLFSQSASIVERPSALFNRAIALIELKRGSEALAVVDRWLSIAGSRATPAEAQEAAELRQQAEALLATLVLSVRPPDARVEINGTRSPASGPQRTLRLDPGASELLVTADGYRSVRSRVELLPGRTKELQVELQAEARIGARSPGTTAPRPPQPRRKAVETRSERASSAGALPYALLASGAGLVVAGAITGLLALDADRDVSEACPSRQDCDPSLRGRRDDAVTLALATDVLIGAGLAGLGTGWLLLELGAKPSAGSAGSASSGSPIFIASVRRTW